jgi:hypothetical protein
MFPSASDLLPNSSIPPESLSIAKIHVEETGEEGGIVPPMISHFHRLKIGADSVLPFPPASTLKTRTEGRTEAILVPSGGYFRPLRILGEIPSFHPQPHH